MPTPTEMQTPDVELLREPAPTSTLTPTPTMTLPTDAPHTQTPTMSVPTETLTPVSPGNALEGLLVFESRREDTNDDGVIDFKDGLHIYRLDLAAEEHTQLTFGHHRDSQPSWSPDGNRIVFISNREGNRELYIMNKDGSELTRLTESLEDEESPDWSPDGSKIAYAQVYLLENGLQERDIMLLTLASNEIQPLVTGPHDDYQPSWSPDGRFLVFTRRADMENDLPPSPAPECHVSENGRHQDTQAGL